MNAARRFLGVHRLPDAVHGRRSAAALPIRHRQGWDKWAAQAEGNPYVPAAAPKPEEMERQEALRPFIAIRNALIAVVFGWTFVLGAIAIVIQAIR